MAIDPVNLVCYYARVDKSITSATTSTYSSNYSSQGITYGSRLLKSGEDQCKTSDKVSNWNAGSFPILLPKNSA
ncbi:MAG: hypothetical protein HKL80_11690 [Acidimicrobiales bacterium]|nr:hypothetical protein [Acidimicrobiales bacterium]